MKDFGLSIDQNLIKLIECRNEDGTVKSRFTQLFLEQAIGGALRHDNLSETGIFIREGGRPYKYSVDEILAANLLSDCEPNRAQLVRRTYADGSRQNIHSRTSTACL